MEGEPFPALRSPAHSVWYHLDLGGQFVAVAGGGCQFYFRQERGEAFGGLGNICAGSVAARVNLQLAGGPFCVPKIAVYRMRSPETNFAGGLIDSDGEARGAVRAIAQFPFDLR